MLLKSRDIREKFLKRSNFRSRRDVEHPSKPRYTELCEMEPTFLCRTELATSLCHGFSAICTSKFCCGGFLFVFLLEIKNLQIPLRLFKIEAFISSHKFLSKMLPIKYLF